MYSLFSSGCLSAVPTAEWSGMLIGIGLLVGLLFGFWLGTYLTIKRDPENTISVEEDPDFYYPPPRERKPTVTRAENLDRERRDLARLPEDR